MSLPIHDLWFRSPLPLLAIAKHLQLRDIELDAENYWEWAIGWLDDVELDITRSHLLARRSLRPGFAQQPPLAHRQP